MFKDSETGLKSHTIYTPKDPGEVATIRRDGGNEGVIFLVGSMIDNKFRFTNGTAGVENQERFEALLKRLNIPINTRNISNG